MTDRSRDPIRTFGRTGGRALSARQQGLIDNALPGLSVAEVDAGTLDPGALFENPREIWFEIGFGGAEHMLEQARRHPDVGILGCEPFLEGIAKALTGIEKGNLCNIRLHQGDARDVLNWIAPGTLDRVFILFPDPWPKKKHRKRRLVQPAMLDALHRACRPGAPVRFATDVKSYADEALWQVLRHGGFKWTAKVADDWRKPPQDHVTTRYETKRLGDCAPVWFDFTTTPEDPGNT